MEEIKNYRKQYEKLFNIKISKGYESYKYVCYRDYLRGIIPNIYGIEV